MLTLRTIVKSQTVPFEVWCSVERFFKTPHDKPPRFVIVLTVYLDESRHEDRDSFMVVAGFWGTSLQWEGFAPNWIAALGKRKALHMKTLRLNSKTGAKRGHKLLSKLGPLPYEHGLTGVYGAVKTGDYLDIIADTSHADHLPGYVVCLIAIMSVMSRRIAGHESIKIVCEIQKHYEAHALRTFRQTIAGPPFNRPERPYFSGIEFIPKDSSVLTQPSDFLAYAIAEGHRDRQSSKAQICDPITGSGVVGLTLGREQIRGIMSRLRTRPLGNYLV